MVKENNRQSTPYDATYKACFSDPRMVESLLRVYADKAIVEGMDFSTLTPYPTEFVTPMLGTVRDDCIWRAKFQGKDCYVLILLEFQSTIDRFMALRVLAYIACLWQHIVTSEKLGANDSLPPVFPMVIYNGKQEWNAPENCLELIGNLPDTLRPYQGLQYYLLDIGRIAENLVRDGKGSAATLVRLERANTPEAYIAVFREIIELGKDPTNKQLCEILNTYLSVLASHNEAVGEALSQALTQGGQSMLVENFQEMLTNLKTKERTEGRIEGRTEGRIEGRTEGRIEGRTEGRIEGRTEGRIEGLLEAALNMLKEKFSLAQISKATGFSEPEVERIAKEHGFSAV